MKQKHAGDVVKGAIAGLVGGIVASFVMSQFQALVTKLAEAEEKQQSKKKTEEPATVKAAQEISEGVFSHKLTKSENEPAGEAVHYAMGASTGLIYGVAAEIEPLTTVGAGMPFGTAVWLIADDVVVPALELSKSPTAYPLTTHAYAISSHLVYGLTTEVTRRAVRRFLG